MLPFHIGIFLTAQTDCHPLTCYGPLSPEIQQVPNNACLSFPVKPAPPQALAADISVDSLRHRLETRRWQNLYQLSTKWELGTEEKNWLSMLVCLR